MSRSRILVVAAAAVGVIVAAGCAPMVPPTWVAAGCYGSPVADAPDFRYSGVQDTRGNLTVSLDISTFTLSTNGSCAGVPLGEPYAFTLVRAADDTAAGVVCTGLGLSNGVGQLQADYPGFPADAWVCNPDVTT